MEKLALLRQRGRLPSVVLACVWGLGIGGTTMMPLQIASAMQRLHLDEGDATLYAGMEMLGMLLGCIAWPKLVRRWPRQLNGGAILMLICFQLLSSLPLPPLPFGLVRFLTGCCEAEFIVMAGICLALHRDAERLWGVVLLLSGLAVAGAFTILSLLPDAAIETGVWYGLALLALLLGARAWAAPAHIPAPAPGIPASRRRLGGKVCLAWGIFLAVYSVQAGVWAVSVLQGKRIGLPLSLTGSLLAISSLLGFFGAVLPAIPLLARHRAMSVGAAALAMLASVAVFFAGTTALAFFLSQLGLNIAFFAIMAILNSFISGQDPDGSLLSRSVIVTFAAVAFGTVGAGELFQRTGGPGVTLFSALVLLACLPLAWAALGAARRFKPAPT